MKITSIKQQLKRTDRYSIFIEGKYCFSLGEKALLESALVFGQDLTKAEIDKYKVISADDKIYGQALRYVAMRPRSAWEVEFYLERKKAAPPLISNILNKLSNINMIDDEKFAITFVSDRQMLRPSSRRKITAELRKKHVSEEIISKVINTAGLDDNLALKEVIERKRRQAKYQDDARLMQYLARQGFGYDDIKSALKD